MKKILFSLGVLIIFAGYAFYQHEQSTQATTSSNNSTQTQTITQNTSPSPTPSPLATVSSGQTGGSAPTPNPTAVATSVPTPTATQSKGQFKDGSYTGSVANAFYGKLQVEAIVSGGKLADVQILQYPSDRGESIQVNSRSNPILVSEALTAQSSNVDIVSGATQSSEAFRQSLNSALSQAQS